MKTDDFISMLATGEVGVALPSMGRRYAMAMFFGALGAALLMATTLGVRHDLMDAISLPMFWVKTLFVASLTGASVYAAMKLSRPGAKTSLIPVVIALPVVSMWGIAAATMIGAAPEEQASLFFGETWKSCPLLIAMLSSPVFIVVMRVMHDCAPTRPRLAGLSAGLLSGAVAALVYCLHCPEMSAPFIGFWYLAGTLIPAGVGSFVGGRYLRW